MEKKYEPGEVVRTLNSGIEGIIIGSEPYFSGTYVIYIVELSYGETVRLGANDFELKDDPIHITLDSARQSAREQGCNTIYLAKDNLCGELVTVIASNRQEYDRIAKANRNLTFYRELNISNNLKNVSEDVPSARRVNGQNVNGIGRHKHVTKVRILLHCEDAVSRHYRYFSTVEELAVFFRSNPVIAKAVNYIPKR